MAIQASTLSAIKSASLSTVIQALGGDLKKTGREFVTKCLWHDDTNPSLTVSDRKGFCFCHVCREGGDAIEYTKKAKGVGFREATEIVCEILKIRFELDDANNEEYHQQKKIKAKAIADLRKEQAQYVDNIKTENAFTLAWKGHCFEDFFKDRNISDEAKEEFGMGYAADGFFSERITIPIHDHLDKLIGFTGRATKAYQVAKYKNSKDSAIFQKKLVLFNENRAYKHALEAGSIIFVEGHLDVIAMWQIGIKNVVAAQGTGTPEPYVFKRLAKNIKNFILCFDADSGGKSAINKYLQALNDLIQNGEINVNIAILPEGKDPDDVINSGLDLYSFIANATPWLDYVIDTWTSELDFSDSVMMVEVEKRLRQVINEIRSNALRTHYIEKASRALSKSKKEADLLIKSWGANRVYVGRRSEWEPRSSFEVRKAVETRLLRIYIHKPASRDKLTPLLDKVTHPPFVWLVNRLKELEEHSSTDLTPYSVMAILAVSESHFVKQLRTLVKPKVLIDSSEPVLEHILTTMNNTVIEF